ncbi:MAG TPA: ABC transporter permease [Bryobacteraceae bacterium]|nr:ABC transporter permease [Bryobacteraceae bacterium]
MFWRTRRSVEQEVEREIRAHLELEAEENPDGARRKFGNIAQTIETTGEVWLPTSLERLWQDARFAVRNMRKSPVYASVAILTLALGIGANSAIFSVVNGVLLKPLPYRDPDRLVTLLFPGQGPIAPADLIAYRQQTRSFETIEGAVGWTATLTGRDRPEHIPGLQISEGTFRMLGTQAMHGRTPLANEFQPGHDRVVVLSHQLWLRRFGGDRAIVGQSITLNGASYTVTGIMPPDFQWMPFWITRAEMWSPLTLADKATNHLGMVRAVARLREGATLASAQAEMDAVCRRLAELWPRTNAGFTVIVEPLRNNVVGDVETALLVLAGAVGFVLLIACANIANLALARAAERQKEVAIRVAIGAAWSRVFRQFLTESLLLAVAGGTLGLLLAGWGVDALKAAVREGSGQFATRLPRLDAIGVDPAALGCTAVLSIVTGVLFGLAPALQATRCPINDNLKEGGRAASEGRGGTSFRSALIVAQVAVCIILLAGAGLLLRSFLGLRAIEPGFDPHNVLAMSVSVAGQKQYTGAAREAFYTRVVEEVRRVPGISSAALINHLPIGGDMWTFRVFAEGRPLPEPGQDIGARYRVCDPGYLPTMRIPLLQGRNLNDHDGPKSPRVAIVNEKLAKQLWPGQSAIGKRFTSDDPRETREPAWLTVVGVVPSVKQHSWTADAAGEYYVALRQQEQMLASTHPWQSYITLVARTAAEPLSTASAVRSAIWSLNGNAAIAEVRSLEQVIATALWQDRLQTLMLAVFAAFAVLLAAIGIYGVTAYSVARRTQEIGIRMALGAGRAAVLWMVLRRSFVLMLAGVTAGLAIALALTRWLATMLYGVTPTDPITFAAIPIIMAAVALIASLLPARRASSVDPATALRC